MTYNIFGSHSPNSNETSSKNAPWPASQPHEPAAASVANQPRSTPTKLVTSAECSTTAHPKPKSHQYSESAAPPSTGTSVRLRVKRLAPITVYVRPRVPLARHFHRVHQNGDRRGRTSSVSAKENWRLARSGPEQISVQLCNGFEDFYGIHIIVLVS